MPTSFGELKWELSGRTASISSGLSKIQLIKELQSLSGRQKILTVTLRGAGRAASTHTAPCQGRQLPPHSKRKLERISVGSDHAWKPLTKQWCGHTCAPCSFGIFLYHILAELPQPCAAVPIPQLQQGTVSAATTTTKETKPIQFSQEKY